MKVDITQKHIDNGKRFSSFMCPLALALEDACPGRRFSVGPSTATIFELDGEEQTYRLPPKAQEFVATFDRQLPVEPLGFELDETPVCGLYDGV
jgi:hypothetical protein